jgi:hypothetical protein
VPFHVDGNEFLLTGNGQSVMNIFLPRPVIVCHFVLPPSEHRR